MVGSATFFVLQNNSITKRLALVYDLKETTGFLEANRNHSALGEAEQLIVIQPPKTTLHGCKMFLFCSQLDTACCTRDHLQNH